VLCVAKGLNHQHAENTTDKTKTRTGYLKMKIKTNGGPLKKKEKKNTLTTKSTKEKKGEK